MVRHIGAVAATFVTKQTLGCLFCFWLIEGKWMDLRLDRDGQGGGSVEMSYLLGLVSPALS